MALRSLIVYLVSAPRRTSLSCRLAAIASAEIHVAIAPQVEPPANGGTTGDSDARGAVKMPVPHLSMAIVLPGVAALLCGCRLRACINTSRRKESEYRMVLHTFPPAASRCTGPQPAHRGDCTAIALLLQVW
jgi:hypothetical protein